MLLSFDIPGVCAVSSTLSFDSRPVTIRPLKTVENFFHARFILQKRKLTRLPIKTADMHNIRHPDCQRQSNIS